MRKNHSKIICIKLAHLPYLDLILLHKQKWDRSSIDLAYVRKRTV